MPFLPQPVPPQPQNTPTATIEKLFGGYLLLIYLPDWTGQYIRILCSTLEECFAYITKYFGEDKG